MNKIIRFICPGIAVFAFLVSTIRVNAQSRPDPQTLERVFSFWSLTMEQVRTEAGADAREFGLYNRFYSHEIDGMEGTFSKGVNEGTINLSNVKDYMAQQKTKLSGLFEKFRGIEKEFPSSVDEYRSKKIFRPAADSCFSSCYNTGFEDGTFNGWYGYYAINNSTTTGFVFTTPVGGYLGSVTRGALDPNTGGGDYQLRVTSGTTTDPFLNTYSTYSMPEVSPFGGNHSVMIGDSSVNGNGMAILSQSFQVPSNTASITYQYSVLLENPNHNVYQQPFFSAAVLDQNGDTIPGCGSYYKNATFVTSAGTGFKPIYYPTEADTVWWLNWNLVNVPLKNYVGQCVTVVFQVVDCALGGHFGYAYVDASCTPENVISSSPEFCGQDSIVLTAPPGWARYFWFGFPDTGIISNDTLQTIYVKDSGTYYVVLTSFSGAACTDTLSIHLGVGPGPIPQPSFHANTVCAGQPVTFINTSNPITGSFYWDFYNLGTYQDSLVTDPTWIYSTPGTYVVRLFELNNGCGAYAYDTITVLPTVSGSFTYSTPGCAPSAVAFIASSIGGTSYFWNFGDTASGTSDTSSQGTLFHTFGTAGTYTVTLVINNGGGCPDTVQQTVIILGPPKALIVGGDSVCAGGVDTLTASGGTSYLWAPGGQTTSSITVTISGVTTFTATVTNGCGSADTTFTVNLSAPPVASVTANKDTVCPRDTVILTASGGSTYLWSNSATGSTISVNPLITTNYTVHVFSPGTTCSDSAEITIYVNPSITSTVTASPDSICPGNSTTLSVSSSSGGVSYLWNTGSTNSSITVSPVTTTTYYVFVSGNCTYDSIAKVVTLLSAPPKPVITGNDSVCSGSVATLIVSGGVTYVWQPGGQTGSTISVTVTNSTTYTVTASNGCASHDTTFTVNVASTPIALLNTPNNTICAGDTIILTAGGGSTYLWNTGSTATTITVYPNTSTSYTVYVSNGLGCMDSAVVLINVSPVITSTVTASPNSICSGQSATLSVTSSGSINYAWNTGSTSSSITVNPLTTTTYYVLTSGICSYDSIPEVITVTSTPSVTITYPDTACYGAATVITANGASSYLWNNGSTGNPITVTLTGDDTIRVIGSNGGCSDTVAKVIRVYPALVKNYVATDSICSGGVVQISVSISGGHPAYSYAWNNGITADSAGPISVTVPPTQYICTVTDACGEVIKDTVKIKNRTAPVAAFYPTPDTVLGGGYVSFVNLTTGANNYIWNLGDGTTVSDTSPYYQYNQAGSYLVTLIATNSYGCIDSVSEYIFVLEKIVIPNVFTPNGDGKNDEFVVTASGMKTFDIQIFDRWGDRVFESTSPNISWNGRSSSGTIESSGVYYYVIKTTDFAGKENSLDGYVQLIK